MFKLLLDCVATLIFLGVIFCLGSGICSSFSTKNLPVGESKVKTPEEIKTSNRAITAIAFILMVLLMWTCPKG